MKNTFAEREKNNGANRQKYDIVCNEFASLYGFQFTGNFRGIMFSKTADDGDMIYTIERWSRMAIATVLRIASKRLSLWINNRTAGTGSTAIYESIIRYDSDYGFYPENIGEYLSEIQSASLPVLEIYKNRATVIEHILNNPRSNSLSARALDYQLCFGQTEEIESFIINRFNTSDKAEITEQIKAEAQDGKSTAYLIHELTELGIVSPSLTPNVEAEQLGLLTGKIVENNIL